MQDPEAAAPALAVPSRADDADPKMVTNPNPGMLQTVLASSPFRRRAKTASEHCALFELLAFSRACR